METTNETWYEEKCAYEYKMAELREENRVLRNQVDQLLRCVQTVEIIDSEGVKKKVKTGEGEERYELGPGETLAPPPPLERVGATAGEQESQTTWRPHRLFAIQRDRRSALSLCTRGPNPPLESAGATAGTDLPKCRYCGEMHDYDDHEPWKYCPCTFCGKRYEECMYSCVGNDMRDEKCTFCGEMESECGGDHSSEQRYIMQVHGGW